MAELPSGTVTFLFSDIEGSTRRWELDPDGMAKALAEHDRIVQAAIERHDGHLVKTTGDGVHAVFAQASDAITAAVACQADLATREQPADPLRIRIGVHTGSAESRAGDYYGPVLNRAARIMAAGHGGQVLCSQATSDLVRDAPGLGAGLQDLGEHRLRDLGRPERIYQVTHPDLLAEFPPLRSLDRYRTNLPIQQSLFVGRDDELKRVSEAIAESPIVTLTGVGGVGKTRLALQAAAEALPSFPGGAWLADLTTVTDPTVVDDSVATSLGLTTAPGRTARDSLLDYLRDRDLLLVLDNCEHLVAAVAELVDAVASACPDVHVLATSREGLAVSGERILAVPPLGMPEGDTEVQVVISDAGRLFVERAHAVNDSFRLDQTNAAALAGLARRLDGIPLAIELAAARVRSMTPADILEHLDQRFRLLTGGRRTALSRQQTLRGAIDWSYELLDEPSRRLFARLGIFVGGFDLRAAEHIGAGGTIDALDIPDLVQGLVDRSLIVADTKRAQARYRMLETIRDYTRERLNESGEIQDLGRRHADYFAAFAIEAGVGIRGRDELPWSDRLEDDLENVRAAVTWLVDARDVDQAMDAVSALAEFGTRLAAPLGAIAGDVAAMSEAERHPLRPVALASAAWSLHQRGADKGQARCLAEDAVDAAGPEPSIARCRSLSALNGIVATDGDIDLAISGSRALLDDAEMLEDRWEALQALTLLAGLGRFFPNGTELAERAVAMAQDVGNPSYLAFSRLGLGLSIIDDDPATARVQLEQARDAAVAANNPYAEAVVLGALGGAYLRLGEHVLAARTVLAAVVSADVSGHRVHTAAAIGALAVTLAAAGDGRCALLLDEWATAGEGMVEKAFQAWELEPLEALRAGQSASDHEEIVARAADLDITGVIDLATEAVETLEAAARGNSKAPRNMTNRS